MADAKATTMIASTGIDGGTSPVPATNGRPLPAPDLRRGTDQAGVRIYNERLVLSLIRRGGGLPKAEIARLTGLSPQTTTTIMNRLEADGLIRRGEPQRGRIGQPAIPYVLDSDGALSIGLKIGRRSTDLVLVDFLGRILKRSGRAHPYPTPPALIADVEAGVAELTRGLDPTLAARIVGFGIATPFELWNWVPEVGAPAAALAAWRDFDVQAELSQRLPWPVHTCNDGTAACAAENFFGRSVSARDFVYVFIGSFIGGGIVLNGNIVPGRTGNAGAIGSLPVPCRRPDGTPGSEQLIRVASLYVLENRLRAAGLDPAVLWRLGEEWTSFEPHLEHWIEETGRNLAILVASATSILDFEAIVVDGAFQPSVRRRIVEATREAMSGLDLQGLTPCEIREGTIGIDARAIGGAALPLLANFARNREVLFKEAADAQRA